MADSDRISRKAGFGYRLGEKPVSESEWIKNTQKQLKEHKKYIADNRFNKMQKIIHLEFDKEDYPRVSGMARTESAAIIYRHIYTERNVKAREQGNLQLSKDIWSKYMDGVPLSLAANRRADFAVNTNYDFLNRLWLFWLNYFTVAQENSAGPLIPHYQEVIRKKMFGKMSDLVYASATHAAMLEYLNNSQSVGPNSRAKKEGWTDRGTNENLARELMELHTVTTARGFTQEDVNSMTNILTGWRVKTWDGKYEVVFDAAYHEPYSQKLLGKKYSGSGSSARHKLKRVVKDLCNDEFTATHISRKLCTHFISDQPSEANIKQLKNTYTKTGGDLVAVYGTLLELIADDHSSTKFLNPEVWLYHSFRLFDADINFRFDEKPWRLSLYSISSILSELGMNHGRARQPNGFPDTEDGWVSNEYMSRRIRLARSLSGIENYFDSDFLRIVRDKGLSVAELKRIGLAGSKVSIINSVEHKSDQIMAVMCSPEFLRV